MFVLDFLNDIDTIRDSFADFYQATVLADETDPNKLHDIQADLDDGGLAWKRGAFQRLRDKIDQLVQLYLGGADRPELGRSRSSMPAWPPTLPISMTDGQVDFKGKAKGKNRADLRLPVHRAALHQRGLGKWRSIFLNFLVSKLPSPVEEDLSKGILDAIDMDSYRVENFASGPEQVTARRQNAVNFDIDPVPGHCG